MNEQQLPEFPNIWTENEFEQLISDAKIELKERILRLEKEHEQLKNDPLVKLSGSIIDRLYNVNREILGCRSLLYGR